MNKPNPFRYFKTSPEVIRQAVMLYVRIPLSLRKVEDLLHERGVDVSHEAVRFWWHRFGPMFASEIRQHRTQGMRIHNLFNSERPLSSRDVYKLNRAAALAVAATLRNLRFCTPAEFETGSHPSDSTLVRGIAMRCCKTDESFSAFIALAATVIRLR